MVSEQYNRFYALILAQDTAGIIAFIDDFPNSGFEEKDANDDTLIHHMARECGYGVLAALATKKTALCNALLDAENSAGETPRLLMQTNAQLMTEDSTALSLLLLNISDDLPPPPPLPRDDSTLESARRALLALATIGDTDGDDAASSSGDDALPVTDAGDHSEIDDDAAFQAAIRASAQETEARELELAIAASLGQSPAQAMADMKEVERRARSAAGKADADSDDDAGASASAGRPPSPSSSGSGEWI